MSKRPDYEVFAREMHHDQMYAGQGYWDGHLAKVVACLAEFGFDSAIWAARGALHDVIEDCMLDIDPMIRYQTIRLGFGDEVANPVWAVSGFGANRKERNACIYGKLLIYPLARPLKCADRIINVETTIQDRSAHVSMYLRERAGFEDVVRAGTPPEMWNRLEAGYAALLPIAAERVFR